MLIKKATKAPAKIDSMIIASKPGEGKTEAVMQLPNFVLFDFEGSSGYYDGDGDIVNIKEICKQEDVGPITAIKMAIKEIKESGKQYRFCILDTISKLEEFTEVLALHNYMETPMGKNFGGSHIHLLPNGGGYSWSRAAFQETIELFDGIGETLILLAHIKDSKIPKNGQEISVLDVSLTGQLKTIFSAKQDCAAILTLEKDQPNKRFLDFTKNETNLFVKTRPEHLRDQKILISEMINKKLTTHWDKVFLDLKK